ncbi:MAG TPA: hypothetical protein VKM55_27330 [Candidatus Lokiarchaeia archaeon]|nr:hypothetical protein [Candidatus Lokiarchaeia archaeon]
MGKDKKPEESPIDFSSAFDQFKNNVDISRDDEGVIIQFKNLAPGMNMDMLKSMLENMMGTGANDLMKRFTKLMGGQDEDEDEDEDVEEDESEDEAMSGETQEPGFRVETLEDGSGFKLIPDDPADIDELLESMKNMFDPEMFKNMLNAAFQLFGIKPQDAAGTEDDDSDDKDKRKKGGDTNMTRDYFYT